MALTITIFKKTVFGDQRCVMGEVAFDASYPTGGEPLDLVDLTDNFLTSPGTSSYLSFSPSKGYVFEWEPSSPAAGTTTGYLIARTFAAAAAHTHTIAVTAGTAGDAVTNNAGVLESSGGQDLTTASGGAISAGLAEVANATDLSACEHVPFIIIGT